LTPHADDPAKSPRTEDLARPFRRPAFNHQFTDSGEDDLLCWGRSERVSAMIRKLSSGEIEIPTAFAIALVIVLSIGAIDLAEIFLGPIEQVEAHQSGNC
jgi:hypothetical protein